MVRSIRSCKGVSGRSGKGVGGKVARATLDTLESRQLMSITLATPVTDVGARPGSADLTVALDGRFTTTNLAGVTGTVVQLPVEYGAGPTKVSSSISVELYDSATPLTVQNFLNYITQGRYDRTFFTSVDTDGAGSRQIRAGRYTFNTSGAEGPVPTFASVPNEFAGSPSVGGKVNVRGTIAADLDDYTKSNSATSGYLINLADDSATYDPLRYTVFGHVIGGLSVADGIAALPTYNVDATSFPRLPLVNYGGVGNAIDQDNLAFIDEPVIVADPQAHFDYTVTISNSKVVTGKLDDSGNLDLKFSAKASGVATVTYTATDLTGAQRTSTFVVTVAAPAIAVTYGATKVANAQAADLDLGTFFTGQDATAILTIKNTGKGVLNLGDVTLPAGLSLAGPLPGSLNPGLSASVKISVDTTVDDATYSGTVSIGNDATSGPFTFPVTAEVGDSVKLGGSVKSVTYVDGDGTKVTYTFKGAGTANVGFVGDGLTATNSKGALTVTGTNVAAGGIVLAGVNSGSGISSSLKGGDGLTSVASLTADGALGTVSLKGVEVDGAIALPGGAKSATLGRLVTASFTGGAIPTLTVGDVSNATLSLGAVTTFKAGALSASTVGFGGNVKTLTVASAAGSTVSATGGVSTLTVSGAASNDVIKAGGSISKFTASSLTGSTLSAGLAAGVGAPTSKGQLTSGVTIGQVNVTAKSGDAFSGSAIYAFGLGKLSLGQLTASGQLSSIAAGSISALGFKSTLGNAFSIKSITSDEGLADQLATADVPSTRLTVDILT